MHTNHLPHILPLATLPPDLDLVGGKAASLARLTQAGLPVPDGFIVTTAMYRQFVTEFGLQTKILDRVKGANFSQPAVLQGISADIQHQFQTTPVPTELARAIEQAYARLPGSTPPVAVRSSATAEDLPGASYAGQQESYLNIRGGEAVFQAVKQCWASLWTARAIAYRFQQGIAPEQVAQAVIVQLLVPADAAGILFTANPVTGDPHQLVISASWGLGEAIVGGRVTPDTILVDKHSRSILERKTATKHIQTVLAEGGTAEQPVPQNLQRAPVLTDQEVQKLVKLGKQVEQLFQTPLDIEWALENGNFMLLQARPITALPEFVPDDDPFIWNDSQSGHYLWSNVNFGEAISRVMTPLTFSVIRFTLKDWEYIPDYPTVGNIGGYPYLNISIFISLFKAMGRSRQDLIDELEAMLYMDLPPDDQLPVIPLKGRLFLRSMWNAGRIQLKQMRGVRKIQSYLDSNPGWFEDITAKIRSAETGQALLRLFQTEIRPHILHGVWCVLGIATFSANYTIKLRRDLAKLVGLEDANILIANMSNGAETLMSLGPVLGLAKVTSGEMTREKFLEKVGHRGPDEFELSVPRPAEDPAWIDQQLNLFRQSPVDVSALLQKQQNRFARVWSRLEKEFPREARFIGKRIRESVRRARLREASRSAYVRDRWSLRLFALRAGELSGLGEDIFFLTLDEVLDLLAGNREMVRFIPARKQTCRQYQLLPPYPPLIQGNFDPFANNRASTAFEDAQTSPWIYGSPGSAGQVEGTARILTDPAEGGQLQPGEILVTYQTDISWTLLFPRAAAIVTDVGAPLTHAAIVARELGIPAVVGCGNATQRLKTGDRIRVDGGLGVVEILPA